MRKILFVFIFLCFTSCCGPMGRMVFEDGMNLIEEEKEKRDAEEQSEPEIAVSIDGSLQMDVPEGWEVYGDPMPFDLRMTNSKCYTGVFVYNYLNFEEDVTAEDILNYHISDVESERNNFYLLHEEIKTLDNKTITHITYSGEKDWTKNIYYFSMVEFEGEERFAIILQTSLPGDFKDTQEEMDAMVESVELIKETISN